MRAITSSAMVLNRNALLMGISVAIGTAATICLAIKGAKYFSGLSERKRKISSKSHNTSRINESKCNVCNNSINLDQKDKYFVCNDCKHCICKETDIRKCAIWIPKSNNWTCKLCNSFTNGSNAACDWLLYQLNEKFSAKNVDAVNSGESMDIAAGSNSCVPAEIKQNQTNEKIVWNRKDDSPLIPLNQRDKVREFIEELISSLLGGSIEDATVGQLYNNYEYLSLFSSYHLALSRKLKQLENSINFLIIGLPLGENEESPQDSYTNLRQLIQRIIEEVFKLPELFDNKPIKSNSSSSGTNDKSMPEFEPKKYEDLLATAVLNKIVEGYNTEKNYENSSGIHSESDLDNNNQNRKIGKQSLDAIINDSSDDLRRSDTGFSEQSMSTVNNNFAHKPASPSYSDNASSPIPQSPTNSDDFLSDYIQNHKVPLPTLNTFDENDFDDMLTDQQNGNDPGAEGIWEENWLFQKRKHKSDNITPTASPSIGMLVPSPTHEVKTLIGDKSADEISDLSEADDDDDSENDDGNESDSQLNSDLPHVLVESKTIIGGKNEVTSFDEHELLQPASLISLQTSDSGPIIMEAKNNLIFLNDQEPSQLSSVDNNVHNGQKVYDVDEAKCIASEIVDSVLEKIDMLSDVSSHNEEAVSEDVCDAANNHRDIIDAANNDTENPVVPIAIDDDRLQSKEIPVPAPRNSISVETVMPKVTAKERESNSSTQTNNSVPININQLTDANDVQYNSLIEDQIPIIDPNLKQSENVSPILIDFTIEEMNNNDNIKSYNPSQETYICKVEPTDFDLILDCVDEIIVQSSADAINDPVVTNKNETKPNLDERNQVNNTKMIAVELASEIETKRHVVYKSESSVLLPIIIENSNNFTNNTVETTNKLMNVTNIDEIYNQISNNNDDSIDTDSDSKSDTPLRDLPGSIAEREHLKWKNAQAIPNNPYSAEALKRRLSQPSSLYNNNKIDVSPAVVQSNFNANLEAKVLSPEISDRDHIRYGRDYYINDAKAPTGTRRRQSDHMISSSDDDYKFTSNTTSDSLQTVVVSASQTLASNSDLFTAKPVYIDESDSKSISTDDSSSTIVNSVSSSRKTSITPSTPQQHDSLTLSEDSDTTRVYDLNKRETKLLRNEVIKTSRRPEGAVLTPPPSPVNSEHSDTGHSLYVNNFIAIQQLTELRSKDERSPSPVSSSPIATSPLLTKQSLFNSKPLSPNTIKFLAPKKKPVFPSSPVAASSTISVTKMADDLLTPPAEFKNLKETFQNGVIDKAVIEEDVLSSLPSVKDLARNFSNESQSPTSPPSYNRPKALILQSPNESGDTKRSLQPSVDSYMPPYNQSYHPISAGHHSITARSLSTKFREELKYSTQDSNNNGMNGDGLSVPGHVSPERPASPVLVPGKLKSNIAFFENLKNK